MIIVAALAALAVLQSVSAVQVANQERVAPEVRAAFDAELIDYPSARFRDVFVSRNPEAEAERGSPGTGYLCGYVNSKNQMGGYAGWKRFMASGSNLFLEGGPSSAIVLEAACGPRSQNDGVDRSAWLVHRE